MSERQLPELSTRRETAEEAARREWVARQATAAPDNMEAAARLLIGLSTTLLGALFGVLALSQDALPPFMRWSGLHGVLVLSVIGLFGCVGAGLGVIFPRPRTFVANDPAQTRDDFDRLVAAKRHWLELSAVAFAAAMLCFGTALLISLLLARG